MRHRQQQESLARFLTYILCRRPDEFGLVLDDQGWLPIKELLRTLAEEKDWGFVRRSHLEEVVNLTHPGQFEISGGLIRSLPVGAVAVRKEEAGWPPPLLYRAITIKSHPVVSERGLQPSTGNQLILAASPEMALRLGHRRDPKALVVTIQAQAAAKKKVVFYRYGEELFLTNAIPVEFLQMPSLPRELIPRPRAKPASPDQVTPLPQLPGSVLLDILGEPIKPWKEKGKKQGPTWKEEVRHQRRKRS
jgi:putative RNA 2'-phosphotransferase